MRRTHDYRRLPFNHGGESLNDIGLPPGYIPPLGGRPERADPIDYEDIVDLKIALETSTTLERFLERV